MILFFEAMSEKCLYLEQTLEQEKDRLKELTQEYQRIIGTG